MSSGEILEVVADCDTFESDVRRFCQRTKTALLWMKDEGQVPELRGFEQFCLGRPAEEMPTITSRICGVCPEAHHMASVKALDALFAVEPPPAAKKIRELLYMAFYVTDHTTHFYVLGGPDFILGPEAPPESRNILGVIRKVGLEAGKQVIDCRSRNHGVIKRARPGRPARAVRGTVPEPGVRALHAGAGAGRGVARGIG